MNVKNCALATRGCKNIVFRCNRQYRCDRRSTLPRFLSTNREPNSKTISVILIEKPIDSSESSDLNKYSLHGTKWALVTEQPLATKNNHAQPPSLLSSFTTTARRLGKSSIQQFLPAQFPESVAPGYTRFATYCFLASVAGSAGMVLSTQTLLFAIGVAGSTESASVMAGALNWVLKDGVGQLGGVIFASQMGKTRRFDSSPKKWRMFGALALDLGSLMEIVSPMLTSTFVLPVACAANVIKNSSFLTIGASRAALHQSLAKAGNLADVTAKSGSQSMAAGLIGTGFGIGLSSVLGHDPAAFAVGFCLLSAAHQSCTYVSLGSIALDSLNRQRLFILVDEYLSRGVVLSPEQVADKEVYFPFTNEDDLDSWLCIGQSISIVFPDGPQSAMLYKEFLAKHRYLVVANAARNASESNSILRDARVQLIFHRDAGGEDIMFGLLHACEVHGARQIEDLSCTPSCERHPEFLRKITHAGWQASLTNIEPAKAARIMFKEKSNASSV